jgi:hypothetical protein
MGAEPGLGGHGFRERAMALLFRNRAASAQRKHAALELMLDARAILGVDDDVVVSVSEHACGDPACCGTQTVILVMRPHRPTEAVRIDKPIDSVTRADLAAALVPPAAARGAARSRPKRPPRSRPAKSDTN